VHAHSYNAGAAFVLTEESIQEGKTLQGVLREVSASRLGASAVDGGSRASGWRDVRR